MSGWIKIHRQILEWEWYSDNNSFRVFLHLLLKANHKQKRYKGLELKIGTIITSRDILAIETGLSIQQIRTALDKLKSTNEVTIKTSSQGTIIEVVNYAKYQLVTNEVTIKEPTSNQQVTTNKNVKKEKNEKELILDSWIDYRKSAKKALTKQSIDSILVKMENYTNEQCMFVINNSIEQGWQGLFWDKIQTIQEKPVYESSDDALYRNVMAQIAKNEQILKAKKNDN
jgi:DNA-binding transcriptional MerR regulator